MITERNIHSDFDPTPPKEVQLVLDKLNNLDSLAKHCVLLLSIATSLFLYANVAKLGEFIDHYINSIPGSQLIKQVAPEASSSPDAVWVTKDNSVIVQLIGTTQAKEMFFQYATTYQDQYSNGEIVLYLVWDNEAEEFHFITPQEIVEGEENLGLTQS